MDFLGAVNRVLVNNTIIKGDDDLVTTFNDLQHEATIRFARNAVTSELNNLSSFFTLPQERATGQIVTVASQRVYTLPADFVQFWGDNPFMYLDTVPVDTDRLYEYKGGEDNLRQQDYQYLTNEGFENWWYFSDALNKSVGFYQVPDAVRTWNFDYEKSVGVMNSTDLLPFQTDQESEAFADMSARRFKYLVDDELRTIDIEKDAEYLFARSTLMNLMRGKNPRNRYGRIYR